MLFIGAAKQPDSHMINFSQHQKNYIDSSIDQHVYLRACPGSGKTEVIAAKVAQEIQQWEQFPAGIAVLSFSRSATKELQDRIAIARQGTMDTYPHFVGTVDGFILKHIATPLAHLITRYQGCEGDFSINVIDEDAVIYVRTKYALEGQNIPANRYYWDRFKDKFIFHHPSQAISRKLNALELKEYQKKDLEETKKRFLEKGFATYKDVENLALEIVSTPILNERIEMLCKRYPLILIDECQDLSAEQIAIFSRLAAHGVFLHLVGDLNQAIYGFRNCFPEAVLTFIRRLGCVEMALDENYRSGQSIVNLHSEIVRSGKTLGRPNNSPRSCYLAEYLECPSEVLIHFDSLSTGHSRSVIVARGHSTLNKLRATNTELLPVQRLAAAIYTFTQNSRGSLRSALTLFARYLAENVIKTNTHGREQFFRLVEIESAEVWHHFLADCLNVLVSKGLADKTLNWKKWCEELKNALPSLSLVPCIKEPMKQVLQNLQEKKHPCPPKMGDVKAALVVPEVSPHVLLRRLATIHEVKGEAHDVTMLVSSGKQGEQSHWKEWLKDPTSEAARFAYVASSRPKHILIWAVKSLTEDDRHKLMRLGFEAHFPAGSDSGLCLF